MTAVAVAAGSVLATVVGVRSMALVGDSLFEVANSDGITAQTAEGEIVEPITMQSGRFIESLEPISGTAQIIEADNNQYFVLGSDFNVAPQEEGLNVLLVPESAPLNNYANVPLDRYINLGQLVTFQGEQWFLIPPGVDLNTFQSAVVVNPLTADTLGYAPFAADVNAEVIEPIEGVVIEPIGDQVQAQGDTVIQPLESAVIEPIGGQAQAQGDTVIAPPEGNVGAPVQTAQGDGVTVSPNAAQAIEAPPAPAVPDRAPRAYW